MQSLVKTHTASIRSAIKTCMGYPDQGQAMTQAHSVDSLRHRDLQPVVVNWFRFAGANQAGSHVDIIRSDVHVGLVYHRKQTLTKIDLPRLSDPCSKHGHEFNASSSSCSSAASR